MNIVTRRIVLLAAPLLLSAQQLIAQVYYRDSTFGVNGVAIPNNYGNALGSAAHQLKKVIAQPDGKILLVGALAGQSPVEIVRLKSNGTIDSAFGQNGYYHGTSTSGTLMYADAALAPDGRILICYQGVSSSLRNSILYRVNANGTSDNTFGSGGQVTITNGPVSWISKIAFQPDGKAMLGGARNISQPVNLYALYRMNTDGTLDNTFGVAGKIENVYQQFSASYTVVTGMAIQPDGKILMSTFVNPATGTDAHAAVIRFKANGNVDSTFAVNGCRTIDSFDFMPAALNRDDATGDIYTFGMNGGMPAIVRLTSGGAIVSSFGTNGHVVINAVTFSQTQGVYSYPVSMIRQRDGKFLFAGISDTSSTSHTIACRLTAAGQLDNTFCNGGVLAIPRGVRDVPMSAEVQANGNILFAGTTYNRAVNRFPWDTTYMYCMRFLDKPNVIDPPQGIKNTTTAAGSIAAYPNPSAGGSFVLAFKGLKTTGTLAVALYDITGRLVATQAYPAGRANGELRFTPAQRLAKGMYVLQVTNDGAGFPAIRLAVE